MERQSKPNRQRPAEFQIAVRLGAAQPVVQMRNMQH
jgi:hypothetical protein